MSDGAIKFSALPKKWQEERKAPPRAKEEEEEEEKEKSDCLNHPLSSSFFLFEGRKEGEDPSSPQSFLFFPSSLFSSLSPFLHPLMKVSVGW